MATKDLLVRILGDSKDLEREFLKGSKSADRFATSVSASAQKSITASARQTERLRALQAEYSQVARTARHGSDEQVAAARLAERATRRLERETDQAGEHARRAGRGFRTFHSDIDKATRGTLAGSGAFRSFGRSIAFASGGFLAFAGVSDFLRKSVDAAIEGEVAQKQLARQLGNSGLSFEKYRKQIEATNLRLGALAGFQNDELNTALTTILRTTGNVAKAQRDLATAADLARAKHIGLNQAALIIAKTEAGNTTLLRRQGFQIAKNATAEQALATLRRVVAGQAAAGTTEQQRFGAVLHDTEEIIGAGVLPTLNRYLARATDWLSQTQNQEAIQKNVNVAMHGTATVLAGLADAYKVASGAARGYNKVLDAFINEKQPSFFRTAAKVLFQPGFGLSQLSKLIQGSTPTPTKDLGFRGIPIPTADIGFRAASLQAQLQRQIDKATQVSATRRNTIFSNLIGRREDRVQDIESLKGQAAELSNIARGIEQEISRVHDKTRKLTLGDDLVKVQRERRGVLQQIAEQAKQSAKDLAEQTKRAAEDAKRAAEDAAANRLRLRNALQFKALGLGPTGDTLTPRVAALRKELARLTSGIDGTILDNKRTSSLISRLRKVMSGGLGALSEDVRKKVAEMLSGLDRQLKDHATKTRDTRRHFDPTKVLAGLGLSPAAFREGEFRLAAIGPGGTVPTRRTGAFALAGGGRPLHIHVDLDGRQVAGTVVVPVEEQLRKRRVQRASSRRGPYAGRN